jgi:hypothetical protein
MRPGVTAVVKDNGISPSDSHAGHPLILGTVLFKHPADAVANDALVQARLDLQSLNHDEEGK